MGQQRIMQRVIPSVCSAVAIWALMIFGIMATTAQAKDGVVEIHGPVKSLPAGNTLIGDWVIGTRTIKVNSSTVIKQETGPAKVGSFVEAKATPQADGSLLATKIEVKQAEGGGGYIELHGAVSALPAGPGFIGDWTVATRKIAVSSTTRLDQTRGAFAVGVQVEVEGYLQGDGSILASKVKTHPENVVEDFKFLGTIGSLPQTANLVGDWMVSGRTVKVTETTKLEQERKTFAVGVYVIVEALPQADGSLIAKEIKAVVVASSSAASFSVGSAAPDTIIAGFGERLSTSTDSAATQPLPTTLGGTTVRIKDSAGVEREAPLFFVSPFQVNFQIPAATALGPATVSISNENGDLVTGTVMIESTQPGIFTANATGSGLAAAQILRVKPNGEQQYETASYWDDSRKMFVAKPIDVTTDDVYLLLFGTGMRHRGSLSFSSALIGGVDAQVLYVGSQPDYAGLDQLNIRLPRSLAGRGEVEVEVEIEGKKANKVKIHIQ